MALSTSSKVKELGKTRAEEILQEFYIKHRKAFKGRLNTSIEVHSVYLVDENELIFKCSDGKRYRNSHTYPSS